MNNQETLAAYAARVVTPDDADARTAALLATVPADVVAKRFARALAENEAHLVEAYRLAEVTDANHRKNVAAIEAALHTWRAGRKAEARRALTELADIGAAHDFGPLDVSPAEPKLLAVFEAMDDPHG